MHSSYLVSIEKENVRARVTHWHLSSSLFYYSSLIHRCLALNIDLEKYEPMARLRYPSLTRLGGVSEGASAVAAKKVTFSAPMRHDMASGLLEIYTGLNEH